MSFALLVCVESKLDSLDLKRAERRLLREYLDLPGLNLSLTQAARLVNVDAPTCEVALSNLVKSHCFSRRRSRTRSMRGRNAEGVRVTRG